MTHTLMQMHAAITGERSNWVIPRSYTKVLDGDFVAAQVLKECVWGTSWVMEHQPDRDGWFYRTEAEWREDAGVSRKQVVRACTTINNKVPGTIERSLRKVNGAPTMHFRVIPEKFEELMEGESILPIGTNGNSPMGKMDSSQGDKTLPTPARTPASAPSGIAPDGAPQAMPLIPEIATTEQPDAKQRANDEAVSLIDAYTETSGKPFPASAGKAINMAKTMVKGGVTPDDVRGCTRWLMSDPWWKAKGFDWGTVVGQIDKWRGRPEPQAKPRQIGGKEEKPIDVVRWMDENHMQWSDAQRARLSAGESWQDVIEPDQQDVLNEELARRRSVRSMAESNPNWV